MCVVHRGKGIKMRQDKDETMIVTIRMKQKVANLFKIIMVKKGVTVTEDLTGHISNQVANYTKIDNNLTFEDKNYSKINIRVNRELYTLYKIQMIVNHTTPTADIIRYILSEIEKNEDILNQLGVTKDM